MANDTRSQDTAWALVADFVAMHDELAQLWPGDTAPVDLAQAFEAFSEVAEVARVELGIRAGGARRRTGRFDLRASIALRSAVARVLANVLGEFAGGDEVPLLHSFDLYREGKKLILSGTTDLWTLDAYLTRLTVSHYGLGDDDHPGGDDGPDDRDPSGRGDGDVARERDVAALFGLSYVRSGG